MIYAPRYQEAREPGPSSIVLDPPDVASAATEAQIRQGKHQQVVDEIGKTGPHTIPFLVSRYRQIFYYIGHIQSVAVVDRLPIRYHFSSCFLPKCKVDYHIY
ncbi:hypothetical protein Q1695_003224 [Nippostrongylus brasiliensis]|nr:hypothetical protein Q1695_003224 [Nippostrongylus brasiliensis]